MTLRLLLSLALLAPGCGYRSSVLLEGEDAGGGDSATPGSRDAGGRDSGDAGDAGVLDSGRASDHTLSDTMACHLQRAEALDAVARTIACEPESRSTFLGLFEAWEAGLLGMDGTGSVYSGHALTRGCAAWRCVARANDCGEYADCVEPAEPTTCTPGEEICRDGAIARCNLEGTAFVSIFACGDVGMTCGPSEMFSGVMACLGHGGCEMRGHIYDFRCEGDDLVICDGAVRTTCDTWRPGGRCQSFAVGGEVPIDFCGPPGFGGAGAYDSDNECDGDVVVFAALGVEPVRYDCAANGYAGCSPRGCVAP